MKKSALFVAFLYLATGALQADVPAFLNYQGKVYDSSGLPIGATGTASAPVASPVNRKVIFRIYDAVSGGTRLWTEEQTVTISVGEFSVLLGQGIAGTGTASSESRPSIESVFTSGSANRYLELTLDNGDNAISAADVPITPRQQITTTAYSFRARSADSIAGALDLAITPLAGSASNHGLGWYGTGRLFGGVAIDGPVLYGNAGGALGSNTNGTYNTALRWNAAGQLGVGTATLAGAAASSKLVLQGNDGSTPAQQLVIRGETDTNKRLLLGFDTTLNQASLQSYSTSTLGAGLALNPQGGNVGIGTSAPEAGPKLNIADGAINTGRFASMQIVTAGTGASYPQLALVRNGWHAAGLGHKQDSNVFGFGNTVSAFDPNFLAINPTNSNVGIGTSNPSSKLHINGGDLRIENTANPSIALASGVGFANLAYVTAAGSYSASAQAGDTVLRTLTGNLHLQSGGQQAGLTVSSSNNVGIGTSVPGTKLSIADGAADNTRYGSLQITREASGHSAAHMAFVRSGNNAIGMGYGRGSSSFGIGEAATGAFSPNLLAIETDGTTRIGSSSTLAKLNIGSKLANFDSFGRLTTNGGNNENTTYNEQLSINASGHIFALQFDVSSDRRVKKDLMVSKGAADLEALLGIEITDYRFKDSMILGNTPHKKVIAQQVESVYPQAVTKGRGEIPDIYQNAPVRDAWVEINSDLKVGEQVKLVYPKGESVVAVLEVKPGAFRPDLELDCDNVFVYGRQVEDFRRVDYDAIAMLNVSATQQIKREKDAEIEALRAENSELREQLDALRMITADLQQRDDVWESRMLAIERSLEGGQAAPKTVSIKATNLAR
ncbi:MAG: hypothetical protein RLZZ245_3922 [Verrucomicrobiota bacterium]